MLRHAWKTIPLALRNELLMGSVGYLHLERASRLVGGQANKGLGLGLMLAAWEEDPLDSGLAARVLARDEHQKLGPDLRSLLMTVALLAKPPDRLDYYKRLLQGLEFAKLFLYLESQLQKSPGHLFWLHQLMTMAALAGEPQRIRDALERTWPGDNDRLTPLRQYLLGDVLLREGDLRRAADQYQAASVVEGWLKPLERLAQCLRLDGDLGRARSLWARILKVRPWHANLILHVHDCLKGLDRAAPRAQGKTAVLVYTYDKAGDLETLLASLADSTDWDMLLALDNGCQDNTAQVLTAWRERLGPKRMETISLPVNVGAPAARNWLMARPELMEFEFAAFVDDDAILPKDWRRRLEAAREAYPEAFVWGCRVVDQVAPYMAQSVDLHVSAPAGPESASRRDNDESGFQLDRAYSRQFLVSTLHNQAIDCGQFSYIRPCASVTGCCHLFSTKRLLEGGGFNLALSPSQFDDLERDIRLCTQGGFACYQGFLPVAHQKRSGNAQRVSIAAQGVGMGNQYKLNAMYDEQAMHELYAAQSALLHKDLAEKMPLVERELALTLED